MLHWNDNRFERSNTKNATLDEIADVSIEVGHVSASHIGKKSMESEMHSCIRRYHHVIKSGEYRDQSRISTVCLIDDYNYQRPAHFFASVSKHVDVLDNLGCCVDYLAFEADLEFLREEFYSLNRHRGVVRYMRKNKVTPCSVHVATWYLLRLGRLKTSMPIYIRKTTSKSFFANQILSILPRYYDVFEDRANRILAKCDIKGVNYLIDHAYFEAGPPFDLEYRTAP